VTGRAFTVIACEQRSPEWFRARLGRLTGSRAADMLATIKSGQPAASRKDLRLDLVVERLTQNPIDDGAGFVNSAMQRGIDKEGDAYAAYQALTGEIAERTGFLSHDTLPIGCSLDGHVGDFAGIVEIKCPKSTTHLSYLRSGVIPPAYLPQIVHNLYVSGAQWCDFLSFDDRFPPHQQTVLIRHLRSESEIASYALAAALFLAEVEAELHDVKGLRVA